MNDLTEKWKNGELDRGKEYWCKVEGEGVLICYLTFSTNKFTSLSGYQIKCLSDDAILEVLARCDYEELRELKEENARQKELLKECQTRITDCLYKIYDEGGHSYPSLEEELKDSLSKLRRYWNEKN